MAIHGSYFWVVLHYLLRHQFRDTLLDTKITPLDVFVVPSISSWLWLSNLSSGDAVVADASPKAAASTAFKKAKRPRASKDVLLDFVVQSWCLTQRCIRNLPILDKKRKALRRRVMGILCINCLLPRAAWDFQQHVWGTEEFRTWNALFYTARVISDRIKKCASKFMICRWLRRQLLHSEIQASAMLQPKAILASAEISVWRLAAWSEFSIVTICA